MRILLDTNALLWVGSSSNNLGKEARRIYRDATEVYFSTFSIFELHIKQAKSKLKISDILPGVLNTQGISELQPRAIDAKEISRFATLIKHDPFDRMILSQAASNELQLLTSDRRLLGLGFDWIKDARK